MAANPRSSYSARKGHFTRATEALREVLGEVPDGQIAAAFTTNAIRKHLEKAEEHFGLMEELSTTVIAAEPAREATYREDLDTLAQNLSNVRARAVRVLQRAAGPAPRQEDGQQEGAGGRRLRPVEALKPFELLLDDSPVRFRIWRQQIEAYFGASNLDLATVAQQQAFFFRSVSAELAAQVRPDVGNDTPAMGDANSCMAALIDLFDVQYPLLQRRNAWFTAKRAEGEPIGQWYARFKQLAAEAELNGLTREDLMVFGILNNVHDQTLADRILRLEQPNLLNVEGVLNAFQVSQNATKGGRSAGPWRNCHGQRGHHRAGPKAKVLALQKKRTRPGEMSFQNCLVQQVSRHWTHRTSLQKQEAAAAAAAARSCCPGRRAGGGTGPQRGPSVHRPAAAIIPRGRNLFGGRNQ